jgi:hypothetical protein
MKNEHDKTMAGGHHLTCARALKQADACWIEQRHGCPDVEDGSQLAPMHLLNDPKVPWVPLCRSGHG